ncbi:MAG: YIP1 family protein [Chloroflexi bacterium]|nr:YIP1 family protein [Chloroflexota bacterium]
MIDRMTRAVQMNIDLYEEVEHSPGLNDEARTVVILVSAAAGVGTLLSGLLGGRLVPGLVGGVVTTIMGVAQWYLWSFLVLMVGTKMFGGTADFGQVSRTIAYAYTPNAVKLFAFVPALGGLLGFLAGIWSLVLGVVAIRQAMDFDTGKAVATVVVAFVLAVVIVSIVSLIIFVPLGIAASPAP